MKVTVDTNVLVRATVRDDKAQSDAAADLLRRASTLAVSVSSLCEFVWVLRSIYQFSRTDVLLSLQALLDSGNVVVDRPVVGAGLAALRAGCDFADGVIAYEGGWLGGEIFVSFDKKAVSVLAAQGYTTRLLR